MFEIFSEELQSVRRELSKKAVSLEPTYPYYAGQAHWAMSLVRRIQMPMEVSRLGSSLGDSGGLGAANGDKAAEHSIA